MTTPCCAPGCCEPQTPQASVAQDPDAIRQQVRQHYRAAQQSCCAPEGVTGQQVALALGYDPALLQELPPQAILSLGCGNPVALASLQPGQTVLDLGSGGGLDCMLAARAVGPTGQVIGVDMTPEMLEKARGHAAQAGLPQISFRLGEMEHLPVADGQVDVILSNCVLNLSPQKEQVLREAFRVLRPGGRLAISDVVALEALPEQVAQNLAAWGGCIAGAAHPDALRGMLQESGFVDIQVTPKPESQALIQSWFPGTGWERYVASATVEARKP